MIDDDQLHRALAGQAFFAKPTCLTREEVNPEALKKETDIAMERLTADPKNAGKPAAIIEKIAAGQVNKFYSTIVLPDQEYYKDGSKTVSKVVQEHGAGIIRFTRFEVGVI